MALFQQSVITKHLQSLDHNLLEQKWKDFSLHFGNATIQNEIRNLKEEQYQGEFLEDLFVKILGYTKAPQPNHNLITEQKNQTNSKKADGAILIDGKVKAVIELKGTDTSDLNKIENQAFGYKNNQPECVYVVTSNFERMRFYIDNAIDFIEFNLFQLSKEEFGLLYVCLSFDNIKNNIPKHLKDESVSKEKKITKELYRDYSEFKEALFNNLVELNPGYDKLLLFKKTQKLLDRFLFIFFAEDRLLLPTNLIRRINLEWKNLRDARVKVSLYDRYKMYFEDLNKGATVTLPAFGKKTGDAITAEFEIFAYNGGLFLPDDVLDAVIIDDVLLYDHSHKLSDYHFESEVDVNILGHIFENSLNEIDRIKAEIEGREIDKTKTTRAKDGVFYTPKYITKYIVDHTIGELCQKKKREFQIVDEEFAKGRKNRNKTTIEKLDKALHSYRNWLLNITICDPACGSGAFLNQALEYLIQEHKYIDSLESKLLGYSFEFPGTEMHILENNIYGVDLNDESVEIAKLSLWLRTAQKGRKLNSLNNNIKCGNSLINDINVAGDKAFSWENEFPNIMKNGGFDIILGNPPYGILMDKQIQAHYTSNFPLTSYKTNLYVLFIERMLQIFDRGVVHFIIPKSLLFNTYYEKIRKELILKTEINEIATINEEVFEDAEVGGSLLIKFTLKNDIQINNKINLISAAKISQFVNSIDLVTNSLPQSYFLKVPNCEISITSETSSTILNKLNKLGKIKDHYNLKNGLNPGNIKDILISDIKKTDNHKKIIWGKDISKYSIEWLGQYIEYDKEIGERISLEDIKSKPGMNKQNKIDFALRSSDLFETKKIVIRKTGDSLIAAIDENHFYFDTLVHGIYLKTPKYSLESLLCILNSTPATSIYRLLHDIKGKVFAKISLDNLSSFPIPKLTTDNNNQFIFYAEKRDMLSKDLILLCRKFSTYFSKQYKIEKLSRKLEKWYELEFIDFVKELNKNIKTAGGSPLSKKDEFEWIELFEANQEKARSIKNEIDKTDLEIDQMVYVLYGLTEEEIKAIKV